MHGTLDDTKPAFDRNAAGTKILFGNGHPELFGQIFEFLINLFGFHGCQSPVEPKRLDHSADRRNARRKLKRSYNSFKLENKAACVIFQSLTKGAETS